MYTRINSYLYLLSLLLLIFTHFHYYYYSHFHHYFCHKYFCNQNLVVLHTGFCPTTNGRRNANLQDILVHSKHRRMSEGNGKLVTSCVANLVPSANTCLSEDKAWNSWKAQLANQPTLYVALYARNAEKWYTICTITHVTANFFLHVTRVKKHVALTHQ